ncbi:uncharacterized protein LOC135814992 [Sycon ciliatum]|uniref:uncharacterized protein LOC135814992 n=1 Tax=Sycon ciliatum TaxID=27933 RepID=UPI0020AB3567|eukprot:scpid76145/ scgid12597/ 
MSNGESVDLAKEIKRLRSENERLLLEADHDRKVLSDQLLQARDEVLVAQRENAILQCNVKELAENNSKLESSLLNVISEKNSLEEEVHILTDALDNTRDACRSATESYTDLHQKVAESGFLYHVISCPSPMHHQSPSRESNDKDQSNSMYSKPPTTYSLKVSLNKRSIQSSLEGTNQSAENE